MLEGLALGRGGGGVLRTWTAGTTGCCGDEDCARRFVAGFTDDTRSGRLAVGFEIGAWVGLALVGSGATVGLMPDVGGLIRGTAGSAWGTGGSATGAAAMASAGAVAVAEPGAWVGLALSGDNGVVVGFVSGAGGSTLGAADGTAGTVVVA